MWKALIRSLARSAIDALVKDAVDAAKAEIDKLTKATPQEREAMKSGVDCLVLRIEDKLKGQ